MNDEKTDEWLKSSVGRDIFGRRKLLVWDAFRSHFSDSTKELCRNYNIDLAIIPNYQ